MHPKMPPPEKTTPHDFIDKVYTIAVILQGPVLPLLRARWGTQAYEHLWFCGVYMLVYAGFAESPEILYWVPAWIILLIFRSLTADRNQESIYRGWPWLGALFVRRERNARFIEAALVLGTGYWWGGPIGTFLMLAGGGLFFTLKVDSMVLQARRRAMQDAYVRGQAMARMQRGENLW